MLSVADLKGGGGGGGGVADASPTQHFERYVTKPFFFFNVEEYKVHNESKRPHYSPPPMDFMDPPLAMITSKERNLSFSNPYRCYAGN